MKHTIILSDGDPLYGRREGRDAKMRANNITCTTVGVATHGNTEDTRMRHREATKGTFYR